MRRQLPAYVPVSAAIIATAIAFHFLSGLRFPVPWIDESYFLLQSLAFARDNTFFAPELIPDRVLMWMQPGYMVLLGLLFKVGDFSLRHARELSLAFYAMAIALFCRTLCGDRLNLRHVFAALIFLVPSSFVVSNVARMEAMILAFGLGTLAAAMGGRFVLATALTLGGALIHPNGVYFGAGVLLAAGIAMRHGTFVACLKRTAAVDWIVLALAVAGVIMYLALIARQLDGFRIDMAFQFARKLGRAPFYRDAKAVALLGVALIATLVFLWRGRSAQAVPAAFAVVMVLIAVNGQEMWYQVFRNVGIGILVVLALAEIERRTLRWIAVAVLASGFVAVSGAGFASMRPKLGGDYVGARAIEILQQRLIQAQREAGGHLSVSFNATGTDMVFLNFLRRQGIELVRRMPTEITPARTVDLCVYIARPEDPAWLRDAWAADLPAPGLCRQGMLMSRSTDDVSMLDAVAYAAYYEALHQARPEQAGKSF